MPSARSSSATAVSSTPSLSRLEAIAYDFWCAPEVEELDGWRLRFGYGVTGRANSVWPNHDGTMPLAGKLERAEQWYTVPAARRRGHARAIVHALARWAAESGARQALLQVEETNLVARRLYAGVGFVPSHSYRYCMER